MEEDNGEVKSFKDLGVCEQLAEACDTLGWKNPSKIQAEAIPHALEGSISLIKLFIILRVILHFTILCICLLPNQLWVKSCTVCLYSLHCCICSGNRITLTR